MDVVGEQRRGERVALIALIALAVEREGERACAVDPAAIGGARTWSFAPRPKSDFRS